MMNLVFGSFFHYIFCLSNLSLLTADILPFLLWCLIFRFDNIFGKLFYLLSFYFHSVNSVKTLWNFCIGLIPKGASGSVCLANRLWKSRIFHFNYLFSVAWFGFRLFLSLAICPYAQCCISKLLGGLLGFLMIFVMWEEAKFMNCFHFKVDFYFFQFLTMLSQVRHCGNCIAF